MAFEKIKNVLVFYAAALGIDLELSRIFFGKREQKARRFNPIAIGVKRNAQKENKMLVLN